MTNTSSTAKRNEYRQRNYAQTAADARNSRAEWTEREDKMVLAHSIPDRELAAKIGRSVQAIQIRRSRIK